jgi:hypothetical protein
LCGDWGFFWPVYEHGLLGYERRLKWICFFFLFCSSFLVCLQFFLFGLFCSFLAKSMSKAEDPLVVRAVQRANAEFAKRKKPAKSTWGSLLSSVGLLSKEEEPPAELLFDAFVAELSSLSREALLAVGAPARADRRRMFASAFAVVALKLVVEMGLDADEMFDKCNGVYASVSGSKDPQVLVEHAQVMIEWMAWRLDHEHLYDTALYYVTEAEYQIQEAK